MRNEKEEKFKAMADEVRQVFAKHGFAGFIASTDGSGAGAHFFVDAPEWSCLTEVGKIGNKSLYSIRVNLSDRSCMESINRTLDGIDGLEKLSLYAQQEIENFRNTIHAGLSTSGISASRVPREGEGEVH